jgi:hypothetical protein
VASKLSIMSRSSEGKPSLCSSGLLGCGVVSNAPHISHNNHLPLSAFHHELPKKKPKLCARKRLPPIECALIASHCCTVVKHMLARSLETLEGAFHLPWDAPVQDVLEHERDGRVVERWTSGGKLEGNHPQRPHVHRWACDEPRWSPACTTPTYMTVSFSKEIVTIAY